jgi:succinate dehydrogenase / fumarate reductase, cytochrome b subunit
MGARLMAEATRPVERPLSPHLLIYHPYATMVMSILHRITGGALYFGTLLLAWWLIAAASGPAAFDTALAVMGSWPGQVVLFGYTWALIHHMLGGIRHLIWDTIHGFGKRERDLLALASIIGSAALTVLLWLISFLLR